MAFEGVILDVDGTLVASNDIHAQAWVEAFSNYGYEIPFEQVRPLIGMGGDQVIPRLVSELNGEEGMGKQIADRRKELVLSKFSNGLVPTNGAGELVKKLRESGLRLIVASSATEQELELLLKVTQVDGLLPEFTTSSDVAASKPAPDLVEAALNKAQLQPDHALMLGDTPYDITAAKKAGVSVIAFRTGGFSDEQLQGALAIYDDPADLLSHYDMSPLAVSAPTVITASDMMMRNTSTNESVEESWRSIQSQVSTFLANATASTAAFFKNNRHLLTTLSWVLLVLLGMRLLFGALDAFDDIPLMSPLLKLIGFVYLVRFVWRYLLRRRDRQELIEKIDRVKGELFGSQS